MMENSHKSDNLYLKINKSQHNSEKKTKNNSIQQLDLDVLLKYMTI